MEESTNGINSNNSCIGSSAPAASGSASGTVTGASALLTSGLTTSLMAEEVLSFLDPTSVLTCMEVSQIKSQFQLTNYYCRQHGSKLGCQEALREEIPKKFFWFAKAGNHAKKKQKNIECEDCVHLEHGIDRCPCCGEMMGQDCIRTCDKPGCGKKACETCTDKEDALLDWCEKCSEWTCKECVPGERMYCWGCDEYEWVCGNCNAFDPLDVYYNCLDGTFCVPCQGRVICAHCGIGKCESCMEPCGCNTN
ncbi:expressed unknown protein [Seminavis robusta]|uniref:Uncharacterized protein n=1 Tax=Seminavis robusta TaxID=568900 RepID=A0A9N8F280_9STRA|nr:expressed unknown protein [Seminavis robusta]|eukprot:Sro2447_g328000.1 n/a (251) ;mRNA; f:4638-5390